jgi:hypothetical protein
MTARTLHQSIIVILAIFLSTESLAGALPDHTFKGPALSGNGHSTHELTNHNLQQTRAKE